MSPSVSVRRRVLGVAALAAVSAAAACIAPTEPIHSYAIGVAKVGDTYRVFVPLCPGEKVVGVTVTDDDPVAPSTGPRPAAEPREVWWQAAGPRAAAGPGEFVALGVDEPFTEVPVRAGGNPARPSIPDRFIAEIDLTGLTGGTKQRQVPVRSAAVPFHPANADPHTATYSGGGGGAPSTPDQIRAGARCALRDAKITQPADAPVPGQQPASSIRAGAAERIDRAMLGPDAVPGRTPIRLSSNYVEDVASHVCGNSAAKSAYSSAFGQQREWKAGELFVIQFAGGFGAVSAADAIKQVESVLGCETYHFLGDSTDIHRVSLPARPSVDRQTMFCERTKRFSDPEFPACTVLLAKGDILTRLVVEAETEQEATRLAADLSSKAAAALQPPA